MKALLTCVVSIGLSAGSAWAHKGHTTPAPWTACAHAELGDACAWQNEARDLYRGTCRSMSGQLVCVRNRPIERAAAAPPSSLHVAAARSGSGAPVALAVSAGVLLAGLGLGGAFRARKSD